MEEIKKNLALASEHNMYVMQGIGMTKDSIRYYDDEYKNKMREEVRLLAETFKNDTSLLAWGIGNEIELGNANIAAAWNFVEELAQLIKSIDKRHLVSTVISYNPSALDSVAKYAPSLDYVGINVYGPMGEVQAVVDRSDYKGAFMITEWGPTGWWETASTEWKAPIELGALWPGATCLAPLGTIFINLMFCIVVPLVFCSLSSSIACMKSPKRAGKIMGTTLLVFIVTGLIAAVIMLFAMRLYPPVLEPWADAAAGEVDEQASVAQLLVNFFTVEDFAALLSRRAMLPLIVFSILIGFGVNLSGGADCLTAKVLQDMTNCLLKVVSLISYYAPVAFFGFFASLVATYGAQITAAYGRAMLVYYPLCFVYALVAFPLYAYLGGGKEGVRVMRRHILRPAVTALGTCSSVATIPTNLEAAEDSGVPRDISDLVLPLGATMHMDGSCLSCVLKIAFLFGVFGIPFEGAGLIVKILLVAVFSSVAMSGIPGGGYIGEYIICTLFFPAQMAIAYPIAVTIGNLVDPPATMINAAGDYVVTFLVARFTEGKDWLERAQREKAAH